MHILQAKWFDNEPVKVCQAVAIANVAFGFKIIADPVSYHPSNGLAVVQNAPARSMALAFSLLRFTTSWAEIGVSERLS